MVESFQKEVISKGASSQHPRRKTSRRKDEQADAEKKQRSMVPQVLSESRDQQQGLLDVLCPQAVTLSGGPGGGGWTPPPRHSADVQCLRLSLSLVPSDPPVILRTKHALTYSNTPQGQCPLQRALSAEFLQARKVPAAVTQQRDKSTGVQAAH